ncbi:MAG TPA: MFS transporter [Patescibacteria group bacterium]
MDLFIFLGYSTSMEQFSLKDIQGKLILFATILASGMAFLDGTVVNIAIPTIQARLNATLSDIQWVVNAYALILSALIMISGALGDKFGRKRIFLYGIGFFSLTSFLCGISQNITQLIIFRALQGVGAAMMIPGSLSIINASFEEKVRGSVIGLWSGLAGGIAAIGPFLGGFLVQILGWSSIFFINLPLGILALFITWKFVPETKNHEFRSIDFAGTVSLFLGLLGLTYALIEQPLLGWGNPMVFITFVIGIILLILFVMIEIRVKHPLVPLEIFKSNLVTGANLATLFLYFALSGVIFFLVLNLQQIQHWPPLLAGLGMLPTILLITFLSGPGGTLADRIGPRLPMIIGPAIVGLGMSIFMIPSTHANYFLTFFPGLILFGLGMSLVIAPLTKSALSVETKYSGSASGVNNAVARIAGLMAVALLGAIVLSLFGTKLTMALNSSHLTFTQKHQILSQKDDLGAVTIPNTFSKEAKDIAQIAVDNSFVYSFRVAMGINASLAFLAAIISFIFIHPKKKE